MGFEATQMGECWNRTRVEKVLFGRWAVGSDVELDKIIPSSQSLVRTMNAKAYYIILP